MRPVILILATAVMVVGSKPPTASAQQPHADTALRAAMETETARGDLRAAIDQYRKVVDAYKQQNPRVAAQALLRMAQCYERLGDAQSEGVYKELIRDFADHEAAAVARTKISAGGRSRGELLTQKTLLRTSEFLQFVSVTDDEKYLTYVADGQNIAVKEIATGRVTHPVPTAPSITYSPLMSPDQTLIAYAVDGGAGTEVRLASLKSDDQVVKTLVPASPERPAVYVRSWLRGGGSLIVETQRPAPDSTWQLAVVSLDGTMRVLTSLNWRRGAGGGLWRTSMSPDSRYLAYAALETNPSKPTPTLTDSTDKHIYLLATDGSRQTQLTTGDGINENPVWSPDGKYIVYVSNRSGTFDLWGVALEGGEPAGPAFIVRRNLGRVIPLAFGRSGSFYFLPTAPADSSIPFVSILDVGLPSLGKITRRQESIGTGNHPRWSPDGNAVLFRRVSPTRTNQLVVRSVSTGEEHAFDELPGDFPSWSPDGRSLIQVQHTDLDTSGSPDLDLEGRLQLPVSTTIRTIGRLTGQSAQERVFPRSPRTRRNAITHAQAVSPDGRIVYRWAGGTGDTHQRIVGFDLHTGDVRDVIGLPEGARSFELSPDGQQLAVLVGEARDPATVGSRVVLLKLEGGAPQDVYASTGSTKRIVAIAWSGDGQSLFVGEQEGQSTSTQLVRIPLQTKIPERTGLAVDRAQTVSVSPDSSRLAVGHWTESTTEVVMITEMSAWLKARR